MKAVRRLSTAACAVACLAAPAGASAAAPPRTLTSYGKLVWNLDALVRDVYGARAVCLDTQHGNLSPGACNLPLAFEGAYSATFANARGSGFRLVKRANPLAGTNAAPLRLAGKYISCGGGRWLATVHGGAFWPLSCEAP